MISLFFCGLLGYLWGHDVRGNSGKVPQGVCPEGPGQVPLQIPRRGGKSVKITLMKSWLSLLYHSIALCVIVVRNNYSFHIITWATQSFSVKCAFCILTCRWRGWILVWKNCHALLSRDKSNKRRGGRGLRYLLLRNHSIRITCINLWKETSVYICYIVNSSCNHGTRST